jgi:hypothetical protein
MFGVWFSAGRYQWRQFHFICFPENSLSQIGGKRREKRYIYVRECNVELI